MPVRFALLLGFCVVALSAAAPAEAPASGSPLTQSVSVVAGTSPGLEYFDSGTDTLYYRPAATGTFTITDSPSDSSSTLASESFPGTATYAQEAANDNPVSYWRLGESSGTAAADVKGANAGTYKGGYTLGQTGTLGDGNTAVLFNGTSGYVDLGSPASLQLNSGTVEAWFKTGGNAKYDAIVSTSGRYYVGVNSNGQLETWDPGTGLDRLSGVVVTDGAWHHVALTFQSGVANGTKVYLDGKLVLTTTLTFTGSGYVTIGSDGGSAEYFPGTIDDVAVYSTILSGAQVEQHYGARANAGTTGFSAFAAWRTAAPWQSNTFTFDTSNTTAPAARTITLADAALNVTSTTVTFVRDVTAPSVGAALSGGPDYDTLSVPLTLSATDASSGVDPATLTLQRDEAALANGTCGAFSGSWGLVALTGGADTTVVSGNCYRYRYEASDRVGNQSGWATTADAVVDTTAPATPSLTLSASGVGSYASGTTFYYRPAAAGGTLTVTATSSDAGTGLDKISFPGLSGGFTPSSATDETAAPYAQTYAWPASTGSESGSETVTAYDQAGNTAGATFTIVQDSTAPSGASASLSGGPWYAAASVPLTVTAGTDAQSGVDPATLAVERDHATLSNGACGAFSGSWTQVTLTGGSDTTVASGNCYRYRVEVSDNVGNTATSAASDDAKIDSSAPTMTAAFAATTGSTYTDGSGTLYYRPGGGGTFAITATLTNASSGPARVTFPGVTGFGTGAVVAAPGPYSASYSYSGTPAEPGSVWLVGASAAGETARADLTIQADPTAPAGVSATVDGDHTTATSVAVTLADGTDTGSGVDTASGVLERAEAPLSAGLCGAFGAWSRVALVVGADASVTAGHCYRYRYRISDRVGNEAVSEPSTDVLVEGASVFTTPAAGDGAAPSASAPAAIDPAVPGGAEPSPSAPAEPGPVAGGEPAVPSASALPVTAAPVNGGSTPRLEPPATRQLPAAVAAPPRERAAQPGSKRPPRPGRFARLRSHLTAIAMKVVTQVARTAAVAGRHSSFPFALALLVAAFLAVQNRIDRSDPKLANAPVAAEPPLSFDRPDAV